MDIPDAAKVCPYCRKAILSPQIKKVALGCALVPVVIFALVVVIVAFVVIGGMFHDSSATKDKGNSESLLYSMMNPKTDPGLEAIGVADVYLKDQLRDPSSLEIIRQEVVGGTESDGVGVMIQYRAKNGFGGMNVETKIFMVKNGAVVSATDFNPGGQ
jgi:hypothetical protein